MDKENFKWSKKEWSQFSNVSEYLTKHCEDIDINNGKIRISNDSKTTIFDIDLPKPITVTIPLAKEFLPAINMFIPEDDNKYVYFYTEDNKFVIEDDKTLLSSNRAYTDISNNSFISDDKFNNNVNEHTKEKVGNLEVGHDIIKRIDILVKLFSIMELKLSIKSSKVVLELDSQSNVKHSKIELSSKIDIPDGTYGLPVGLFLVPWDDLNIIKVYNVFEDHNTKKVIVSNEGYISDLFVKFYCVVAQKNENKDSKYKR